MPRYRRSDFGSITKLPSGSYRIRWWEDTDGGRKRRSETIRGTRREASRRLAEIQRVADTPAEMTLKYYADRYYWPSVAHLRKNTLDSYENAYKKIDERFGSTPVSAIKPDMINDELQKQAAHAAKVYLRVLKSILECARIYGSLTDNPADRKFRLPDAKVEYCKDIYTLDQLDALWDVYRGWDVEAALMLQAYAGVRVGESLGVMVEDVKFYDGYATIKVWRQVHRDGRIDEPKTDTGVRTTMMVDPYASRLRELVESGDHDGGWLVANGLGEPISRNSLKRRWTKLMNNRPDGVPKIIMRNLRPSYETWMHWKYSVNIETMAKAMGHKDTSTTLSHYDRPSEDLIIAAAVREMREVEPITCPNRVPSAVPYRHL